MYFFHLYDKSAKQGVYIDEYSYIEPYELHSHDYYEIEFIIKGAGVQIIEQTVYDIRPGMICLLNPMSSHEIHPTQEIFRYNISFDENVLSKAFMNKFFSNENAHVAYLNKEVCDLLLQITVNLMELLKEQHPQPYTGWLVENYISAIILNIFRYKEGMAIVQDNDFNDILSYISNNLENQISLKDVAAYVGYTPSYFSTVFKRKTGDTFTAYLTGKRISYAKKLLATTKMPIKDVAANSGFTSIGRFNKVFLKHVGVNASTYRKNNKH